METVTIASMHRHDMTVYRSYGQGIFRIKGRSGDELYGLTVVRDCFDKIDMGNGPSGPKNPNATYPVPIRAIDVAKDVTQGYAGLGIFICKGEKPTIEELREASEAVKKEASGKVMEADVLWEKPGTRVEITDFHRDCC